ncbi:urate hydroxylase PuuD [Chachezhania antarctica]|uniref:urate hydroxylase PuuD n=1 Tax=Chachezhania antarctica TaxID=2340860 RepID=UPI000EB571FB|nr:urate hydroxylase PuuD [Chachezhania antarctica]|tara:strand:+ start:945 stop:2192 length:1248 start_codon:yes stop_codon:yes gene_type:complete
MLDFATISVIAWDWVAFALRWLHVIVGIAWIGSSFYFIALDLGLKKAPGMPTGAHGEEWQVHGGGFYHITKFLVAPERMPEHLVWFKWESYATWLSGAALLMVVYWANADIFLVDTSMVDIAPWRGIIVSAGSLGLGWLVYDALCKSKLGHHPTELMLILFVLLVALGWGYTHIFTGRATFLHLGAFTATIMTANVFFVIIPNQRIVVADLKAGRTPDPEYGRIAKLRSTHNNYLTLPVIFMMLSNHYPLAFATPFNWIIAGLVFLMGVTIRHFHNTDNAGKGKPWWTWGVTAALFLTIVGLSLAGLARLPAAAPDGTAARNPAHVRLAEAPGFDTVHQTIQGRCSMCHARTPSYDGIAVAPKGVYLETEDDLLTNAREVFLQAGASTAMPPANVTYMEPADRAAIVRWYAAGRS